MSQLEDQLDHLPKALVKAFRQSPARVYCFSCFSLSFQLSAYSEDSRCATAKANNCHRRKRCGDLGRSLMCWFRPARSARCCDSLPSTRLGSFADRLLRGSWQRKRLWRPAAPGTRSLCSPARGLYEKDFIKFLVLHSKPFVPCRLTCWQTGLSSKGILARWCRRAPVSYRHCYLSSELRAETVCLVTYRLKTSGVVASASSEEQTEIQPLGGQDFSVSAQRSTLPPCACFCFPAEGSLGESKTGSCRAGTPSLQAIARLRQVAFDPLDGSSIVGANFAVGSIFGIWPGAQLLGCKAGDQVAALYSIYGPKTMLVMAVPAGEGVCYRLPSQCCSHAAFLHSAQWLYAPFLDPFSHMLYES